MRKKPELLVPASSLEVLRIAVMFGADAVYIGGEAFGLRAKAKNFSMEEMAEGIRFAHEHDVKVYVTANILAHNDDLEGVRAYFEELKNGVISTNVDPQLSHGIESLKAELSELMDDTDDTFEMIILRNSGAKPVSLEITDDGKIREL